MKAELDSLVMNLTSTSSLKLTFLTTTADEDDDDDDEDDDDDDDDEDSRFGALTNSLHCLFTFPRTRFLAPGCNCLRAYCTRLLLFSSGIKLSSSSCSVDVKAHDVDEEERSDSQTWQESALGTCKMQQSRHTFQFSEAEGQTDGNADDDDDDDDDEETEEEGETNDDDDEDDDDDDGNSGAERGAETDDDDDEDNDDDKASA